MINLRYMRQLKEFLPTLFMSECTQSIIHNKIQKQYQSQTDKILFNKGNKITNLNTLKLNTY